METLKFLMTTNTYPPYHIGGDATHVKYLAGELAKRGHEVHVMHSMDAYTLFRKNDGAKIEEEKSSVHIHTLRSRLGRADPLSSLLLGNSSSSIKKFRQILNDVAPDIVHHHNVSELGYLLLRKYGDYASLYTAHSYWLICPNQRLLKPDGAFCCERYGCLPCSVCSIRSRKPLQVWRSLGSFKEAIKSIDVIIAPSNFMRERLQEGLQYHANIAHIPNFVPPPADIKGSGYSNFFLYVGVVEMHKGICSLLKLFKEHGSEIDAKLIIVGNGSLKRKIEEYIERNNLAGKVIVLGWVHDDMLLSLYKDALALVLPSIWPENNPIVALEALSAGTPVIGPDAGGLGEIIARVDKNLIFKKDGLEEIILILNNRDFHSRERIKQIYNQWYSPEGYMGDYMKIIKNRSGSDGK